MVGKALFFIELKAVFYDYCSHNRSSCRRTEVAARPHTLTSPWQGIEHTLSIDYTRKYLVFDPISSKMLFYVLIYHMRTWANTMARMRARKMARNITKIIAIVTILISSSNKMFYMIAKKLHPSFFSLFNVQFKKNQIKHDLEPRKAKRKQCLIRTIIVF